MNPHEENPCPKTDESTVKALVEYETSKLANPKTDSEKHPSHYCFLVAGWDFILGDQHSGLDQIADPEAALEGVEKGW